MSNSAFTPTVLQDFREASVSQSGIVNTTAQTFGGIKTYDPSVAFTPKSGFATGYQLWKDTSSRLRLNFSGGLLFANDTDATTYLSCGSSGQWTIGNSADTSFPGNNIVGRKDGSSVSAGYVGELVSYSLIRSSNYSLTSGVPHNIAASNGTPALVLTKGYWLISGIGGIVGAASTVITTANIALSDTDATIPGSGDMVGLPSSGGQFRVFEGYPSGHAPFGGGDLQLVIRPYILYLPSGATLYFVAQCNFSVANLGVYGAVQALRIMA